MVCIMHIWKLLKTGRGGGYHTEHMSGPQCVNAEALQKPSLLSKEIPLHGLPPNIVHSNINFGLNLPLQKFQFPHDIASEFILSDTLFHPSISDITGIKKSFSPASLFPSLPALPHDRNIYGMSTLHGMFPQHLHFPFWVMPLPHLIKLYICL